VNFQEKLDLFQKLVAQRGEIDRQLSEFFGDATPESKERRCKICNQTGHTSKTCSTHNAPPETPKLI
jgi:hypothetical protein